MTANDLKSRYGIKLTHELGKPLYIQDVDVKKAFINSLPQRVALLIFLLFGSGVGVLLLYGSFFYYDYAYYSFDYKLFDKLFYFVTGLGFFAVFTPLLFAMIKGFFDVDLWVIGDKGIVNYRFWPNEKLKDHKIILWSHDMELETTYTKGYYGRALPMFRPDYFKIKYKWHQGKEYVTSLEYDTRAKPRDSDKEIAEAAKQSFEVYRITRKHHG